MQDRPTSLELIEAVTEHLMENVVPELAEPRLRFRTLVAANVLAVVGREMALAPEQAPAEWRRLARLLDEPMAAPPGSYKEQVTAIKQLNERLCEGIIAGDFDGAVRWQQLLDHCQQTTREKLAIANPGYLERTQMMVEEEEANKKARSDDQA